jgi:hypothetical protein
MAVEMLRGPDHIAMRVAGGFSIPRHDNRAAVGAGRQTAGFRLGHRFRMTRPAAVTKTYPLVGIFDSAEGAERAYQACVDRGYEVGQVNVVISEGTRRRLLRSDDEIKEELAKPEAEGGELGGPKGGRAGLLMTVFAAVGAAVAVPALGLVAGPLAVALAAAGAAGVTGGVITALGDWGVPEERVRGYEADIRKGAILMSVEASSAEDARAVADDWKRFGGRDIHLA